MLKPYYSDDAVQIFHGDCLEILPQLGPIDHVITDPPYSEYVHDMIKAARRPNRGLRHETDPGKHLQPMDFDHLSAEIRLAAGLGISALCRRWCLVFSDIESAHLWRNALVPLRYIRTGCWIKGNCTPQFSGDRPAVGFEAITIVHGPSASRWSGGGKPAVWYHNICRDDDRAHRAQKPLALISELIGLFTDPGELILDPFGGSGTTARAAKDLGRRCILIEKSEAYCEITARRMGQSILNFNHRTEP